MRASNGTLESKKTVIDQMCQSKLNFVREDHQLVENRFWGRIKFISMGFSREEVLGLDESYLSKFN